MKQQLLIAIGAVFAAACGGAPAGTPDGRPGDLVSVTVWGNPSRAPQAGVPVVFSHADGSVAAVVISDASGHASAQVEAGGMVTSVLSGGIGHNADMQTIVGVIPGDTITLGRQVHDTALGTFTVKAIPMTDATTYRIDLSCGIETDQTTLPAAIDVTDACTTHPVNVQVVALKSTGNGFAKLGSVNATGISITAGGAVTMPATWQPPHDFVATFTHVDPSVIGVINLQRQTPFDAYSTDGWTNATIADSMATATLFDSDATPGVVLVTSLERVLTTGRPPVQRAYAAYAGDAWTYSQDVSVGRMPWIDGATFDPATATFHVRAETGGTGDLQHVKTLYTRPSVDYGFTWEVFGPPQADVVLPTLPGDLAIDNPARGDVVSDSVTDATIVWADGAHHYDAIRSHVVETYDQLSFGSLVPASLSGSSIFALPP